MPVCNTDLTFCYRDIAHCTAKFCGKKGGEDYASRQVVVDSLGKAFKLRVIGFVVTPRTFGARILLDEEELRLWGQDDDELRPEGGGGLGEKKSARKGRGGNNASAGSRREDFLRQEPVDDGGGDPLESGEDFEAGGGDRFYPVPGRGRRAHVTLGTRGEDVRPVETGLDLLEAVRAEKEAHEGGGGEAAPETFETEGAWLRRYSDGLWVVYLRRAAVFETVFTGHYT